MHPLTYQISIHHEKLYKNDALRQENRLIQAD